jgi:predicted porin
MMKKMMMMAVMALVALTASAQKTLHEKGTITLQPKVGLALGSFSGDYTKEAGESDPKLRPGFIAGVEGEYYITDWFSAAAGVSYAQQGWKVNSNTLKLDYLNVPVVADFYVARGLALKTGVQFGFLMNAKADEGDIKNSCEKFNFSIPVGISYEISNFVLDIRYNIALTKVNKYDGGHNEKNRSDLVQFTVGYKFEL